MAGGRQFNSSGEARFSAVDYLDWARKTRERQERGEAVTPIESSLMETIEKCAADAFNETFGE